MPTVDFATVTLSVDEGRVEAHFPKAHPEVKDVLKSLKGRWVPDRRCWVVTPRYIRSDEAAVVNAVEEALLASAPRKWPSVVQKFAPFACATKRYEVKFGSGGVRLAFPPGHPCHWHLERMEGASKQGDGWLIPARHAKTAEIMPLIKRGAAEDARDFVDAVEPYAGRYMKGTLPILPDEADAMGIRPGRVVFAEYLFVKEADPAIVNMPIHAWPFKVASREDVPGEGYEDLETGISVRLDHLEPGHALKAVRKLMTMPEEDRPRRLDKPHALGKWYARRG